MNGQSPFKSASDIVEAIQAERGGKWELAQDYIGGRGNIPLALNKDSREIMTLHQDALGGWWIEKQVRQGVWILDTDYTLSIARNVKPNLLTLARNQAKSQWHSGEVLYLIPKRAYLKNDGDGHVHLCLTSKDKALEVFYLSHKSGWIESPNLDRKYQEWVKAIAR